MQIVDFRYDEETDRYELFPTDEPDLTIASVDTEEEAEGLLSYINR